MFDIVLWNPENIWKEKDGCRIEFIPNIQEDAPSKLYIPFKKVAEKVFDKVINTTIELLDIQIRKIKGPIKATFLVGGLGRSPYLQQKIQENFRISKDSYRCGNIIADEQGDLATMRGAVYYGIESSLSAPQTDIHDSRNQRDMLHLTPGKYDTLICYGLLYRVFRV